MDVQLGEILGLFVFFGIIGWQCFTEWRIRREIKKWKLKEITKQIIEILADIKKSGVFDTP